MPFVFSRTGLAGVVLIEPRVFGDQRGFFIETYKHSDFTSAGIPDRFVQDNLSSSAKGVLRGLHYQQAPHGQGKLVQCLQGRIFDVAVDIRKGSPSYGRWAGFELGSEDRRMLYIPPGFAHGFQALTEQAEVLYKCTAEYHPESDRGIIWNDPDLTISWPIKDPILSEKDTALPRLKDADNNFTV